MITATARVRQKGSKVAHDLAGGTLPSQAYRGNGRRRATRAVGSFLALQVGRFAIRNTLEGQQMGDFSGGGD